MSASVTFLSLPSLDDVARLTGFLAILFSASSMVSSVLALFRYKTDIDRSVVYIGSQGLTHLSVCYSRRATVRPILTGTCSGVA